MITIFQNPKYLSIGYLDPLGKDFKFEGFMALWDVWCLSDLAQVLQRNVGTFNDALSVRVSGWTLSFSGRGLRGEGYTAASTNPQCLLRDQGMHGTPRDNAPQLIRHAPTAACRP